MKLEVLVNGRAGELQLDSSHFEYHGLVRDYSIEPAGPGIFSILIDGRSYQATVLAPGTVQVNARIFSVEIFKTSLRPCPEKSCACWCPPATRSKWAKA